MSAIVGIYYRDGRSLESQSLTKMLDFLAHRGKDRVDIWHRDSIGLGHRLHRTTPESLYERQPLVSRSGNLVLTADARIDNREELISSLELTDIPESEITDSQLILAAYEKWGKDCPDKLLGDFAFAIWDERSQSLFCARDHFGVKPFYYYTSDSVFIFASEIKAISCLPEVPLQLNEVRVGDYLATMFEDRENTFYQGIFRLPPAHSLTVNADGIELESYWSLDPSKELILDSDEEYAAQFREIFTEAVRCRLRSHTQVGTMLSGGLDSSSITCTARRIMNEKGITNKLPTYSAIFDKVKECDESFYINSVLKQGGYEPNYIYGDRRSPLADLDKVLWHQDEPLYAFNLSLNTGLYDLARKQGVRVILDGFDGDSTVSHGVGYLRDLARDGKWLTLFQELKEYTRNHDLSFWKIQQAYIVNYGINPSIDRSKLLKQVRRLWRGLVRRIKKSKQPAVSWKDGLDSDFIEQINLEQRRRTQRKPLIESQINQRAEHHYSLVRGVMPYTLEVLNKTAAADGIELRFPFWDKRLVEFCLSLPGEQKIRRGWTRMVMRRGLKGILPPEIEYRAGKSNFAPNFSRGLFDFERQRIESLFDDNSESIAPYIDLEVLKAASAKFLTQQATGDDEMYIWRALTFSLWQEKYLAQLSPDEIQTASKEMVHPEPKTEMVSIE